MCMTNCASSSSSTLCWEETVAPAILVICFFAPDVLTPTLAAEGERGRPSCMEIDPALPRTSGTTSTKPAAAWPLLGGEAWASLGRERLRTPAMTVKKSLSVRLESEGEICLHLVMRSSNLASFEVRRQRRRSSLTSMRPSPFRSLRWRRWAAEEQQRVSPWATCSSSRMCVHFSKGSDKRRELLGGELGKVAGKRRCAVRGRHAGRVWQPESRRPARDVSPDRRAAPRTALLVQAQLAAAQPAAAS